MQNRQDQISSRGKQHLSFLPDGCFICKITPSKQQDEHLFSLTFSFKGEDTTIGQLIKIYLERGRTAINIEKDKYLSLQLPRVGTLAQDMTIQQLKTELNNYDLTHFQFIATIVVGINFTFQCHSFQHFEQNPFYKDPKSDENFFQIFLDLPQFNIRQYRKLNCISKVYQQILSFLTEKAEQTSNIYKRITAKNIDAKCAGCEDIIKMDSTVYVQLKDHPTIKIIIFGIDVVEVRNVPLKSSFTLIIKENFEEVLGIFDFQSIKELKLYTLLHHCQVQNCKKYGIKVRNKLLKPYQRLEQIEEALKQGEVKVFEAWLVRQYQMFYSHKRERNDRFTLRDLNRLTNLVNTDLQLRRNLRILEIQTPTYREHTFFDPIFIYTSPVKYSELNLFLRKLSFSNIEYFNNNANDWQWVFPFALIDSLFKLPNYSGKVYRGVDYMDVIFNQVGKIECFKTFVSSSYIQERAINFTRSNGTLYIIESLTGKNITEFSYFPYQCQVLFMPYTYFQVTAIDKQSNPQITKIYMREIPILRRRDSNILLWVDDKTTEGSMVYSNLMKDFPKITTQIVQLLSNDHLNRWMKMFGYLIKVNEVQRPEERNKLRKVTLITDMKRADLLEEGVESIKIVRRYNPHIEILVYVGDLQGTKATLKRHEIELNDRLMVGNQRKTLMQFIKQKVLTQKQQQVGCQLI